MKCPEGFLSPMGYRPLHEKLRWKIFPFIVFIEKKVDGYSVDRNYNSWNHPINLLIKKRDHKKPIFAIVHCTWFRQHTYD